jgi:hypothetical protein
VVDDDDDDDEEEVVCFQHMAEMLYGLIYGQQFVVISAVFLLGWDVAYRSSACPETGGADWQS